MPEEVDAELEVVHRYALVRGVDEPSRDLGLHRSRREEAVRDGAERLPQPVKPEQQIGAGRAPGSSPDTNDSTARQSGVSSGERVPPQRSIHSRS